MAEEAKSEKIHVVTTRVASPRFGRRAVDLPAIAVVLTNRGGEPMEFSPEKIEAFADATPLKVYQGHEYLALGRAEAQIASVASEARELGKMRSVQPMGWVPDKPQLAARLEGMTERAEIRHRQSRLLDGLSQMLYAKTVAPGETFGGVIRIEAKRLLSAQKLRLRVPAGVEIHEFVFAVSR